MNPLRPARCVVSLSAPLVGLLAVASPARAQGDYCPQVREVVLNTDFTQIGTCNGPIRNVTGGVFVFRNVTIPQGVTVRGTGTRPMIWVATGDFTVEGTLSVDGGAGESVHTLNAANFPSAGGIGVCSGGNGGRGSPNTTGTSITGEAGFGPFQLPGLGGLGGAISCLFQVQRGTGGGGGAMATRGDPSYPYAGPQQLGFGGVGGQRVPNSPPGGLVFTDGRNDNDFWGLGADVFRRVLIVGELPFPIGGEGGGGGGDQSPLCVNNANWIADAKGGGGGGAAGALIVYALGTIRVGPSGRISANGGDGGGGEEVGSNRRGGGGGGGSGGSVVLMSEKTIDLHVHGETYGNGDYAFSVSADGGIGTESTFASPGFGPKYPPRPHRETNGGMGGMGLVQLMTPLDVRNLDQTNTILDDNVRLWRGTTALAGAEKQRFLAWRGFPTATGSYVDDAGRQVTIGSNEGDLRPSPVLVPLLR